MVARTKAAARRWAGLRGVKKVYYALCACGSGAGKKMKVQVGWKGICRERLVMEDGRVRLAKEEEEEEGKEAVSEWEVVQLSRDRSVRLSRLLFYMAILTPAQIALLRLHLLTGHKHQLRVHLSRALSRASPSLLCCFSF